MQVRGDAWCGAQQQRGQQHRAECRGQQQAADVGGYEAVLLHQRHQGKAEFAALGQRQATAPGGFTVAAAPFHQDGDHAALDEHQAEGQSQDQQAVIEEQLQVNQHADADKEQPQQDVAERAYVGFDLMSVVAFPQQHARQERTQGR
ncbi:hypothetical protein D3C78_1458920 [compost metagenome]